MFFMNAVKANISMQYKNYFFNNTIYMSLFIWPFILFVNAFYSFKPFSENVVFETLHASSMEEVYLYLFIGFVSMMFFWSLVQSAWSTANMMRYSGTLELLYMSPANRYGTLLGNAISSLLGSVWMLVITSFIIIGINWKGLNIHLPSAIISLFILVCISIVWGVFLNSLFLISRDGGFLYTILEAPMEIFSGVKIPYMVMPVWAKLIGSFFPLTYTLMLLRGSLLYGQNLMDMKIELGFTLLIFVFLISLSNLFIFLGEKNAKKHGTATLF